MTQYSQFIFEDYTFDAKSKELRLQYSLDGKIQFTETYRFLFDFAPNYGPEALERACELLFLLAGVSYYKTYLPPEIVVKKAQIDKTLKNFLDTTYQKGLGEFFYVNNLDPRTVINFPVTTGETVSIPTGSTSGLLIGLGGGKDSLVTTELLGRQPEVATWSVGHAEQLAPLVQTTGLPHISIERIWDRQLLVLNRLSSAYNGHVPISAILACVGVVTAILTGKRDVVVSNESSASEPNLTYQGVAINHQYSKSLEFEQAFQSVLTSNFGDSVRYYSALRPLSELHIAELFAKTGFEKYKDVFSSCNKAYTHNSHEMFWCGNCPKCAFVFLALTPFVEREKLETLFHGNNLLLDPDLEPIYRQLLGIEGNKPLECVGEVKESRAAMRLAQKTYPELDKYQFDLPEDYNYKTLSPHCMPEELYEILATHLSS